MTDMCLRIDVLPQGITLLPLQGEFATIHQPRALPWAMGCCPFGARLSRREFHECKNYFQKNRKEDEV